MATLSLNLLQMSVSLAREEPEYTDIAERFLYDFVQLATTLNTEAVIDSKAKVLRSYKNWDDEDGFYYDVIKRPDGSWEYLRSRSIAGLIRCWRWPVFRWTRLRSCRFSMSRRSQVAEQRTRSAHLVTEHFGLWHNDRTLFAAVPEENLRRICEYLFDEEEFLSPHGIRSLSKYYEKNPYSFCEGEASATLAYSPADSPVAMFGGNSNWRGPVWMPFNYLLIEALQKFGHYYGDSLKVEFPTRSGNWINLWDASWNWRNAWWGCSAAMRRASVHLMERWSCFKAIPIGRICCSSTSTSTAITAPVLAPAIRPDGPPWSSNCSPNCSATPPRSAAAHRHAQPWISTLKC